MSAFIVSSDHITAILAGYTLRSSRDERLTPEELTIMGKMLWLENCRSVAYRYDEEPDACWTEFKFETRYRVYPPVTEIPALLKLCDCLEYQSCERPDYEDSQAYKRLQRIRGTLIRALPGYEAAPWAFCFPTAATAAA